MKRYIYLVFIGLATFIFGGCEGPAGPPGIDGLNGADGEDGTASCLVCHAGTVMEAIESQFYASQHAKGDIAVDYAGGNGSCAECHSHQGYVEWSITGDVAEGFSAPEAWQCGTCHGLHETFEAADYAFRAGNPVTLEDGTVIDGGNNNTCINCHKARRGDGYYDKYTVATVLTNQKLANASTTDYDFYKALYDAGNLHLGTTGAVTSDNGVDTFFVTVDIPTTHVWVSSAHAGPHHGPQGNVWAGVGAAGDVTGSAFGPHDGGCVECHMGEASGHSFIAKEENCTECHTSKESEMNTIADRLEAVAHALEGIHAVHIDDAWKSGDPLYGSAHPVVNMISRAEYQALWNFLIVMEDRSLSAHNPTYVKALLTQCEDALGI